MAKKMYVLTDGRPDAEILAVQYADETELDSLQDRALDATDGNLSWSEYHPAPLPASGAVTFTQSAGIGNVYFCSIPADRGDLSGEYFPAQSVRALVEFAKEFVDNFDTCSRCDGTGAELNNADACDKCGGLGVWAVSVGTLSADLLPQAQAALAQLDGA